MLGLIEASRCPPPMRSHTQKHTIESLCIVPDQPDETTILDKDV